MKTNQLIAIAICNQTGCSKVIAPTKIQTPVTYSLKPTTGQSTYLTSLVETMRRVLQKFQFFKI